MLNTGVPSQTSDAIPTFWRDAELPFIEARDVKDGRKVCYAKHTHECFSIGAITSGRSTYLNGRVCEQVGAGTVVVINPGDVHACNPIRDQPWSYRMFYVDTGWLTALQHELGFRNDLNFQAFAMRSTTHASLHAGLGRLYVTLSDDHADSLKKQCAVVGYFAEVQRVLNAAPRVPKEPNRKLARVAGYIRENCTRSLKLKEICAVGNISASYLIRAFKEQYGMTPHTYQINCRIEYCRAELRRRRSIADVAVEAGFSDQAHLQRVFKQFVAATPGQYRG
ncbi:AraC family transcriptional regulator [Trinickia caryophylli]|uniref:Transcriptional regulator, AraC family n=1 Tax=Trinickia caryophylli TaxID=28094 RepID=A0A1X7EVW2_TRICW|nr:AraC family transcriptional regulator [Trinickia caryophylli]PMS09716.1 AraC family transcriptional regulator [Trinickia caryophylli]TRX18486.1 AraC family transcriptional regulator [Trinickia caryophylli]WQE10725.1 AraC family transcriptional regulator [Trinickia caryophylli]SMF40971.1 transcriptional regulator, AraC family [Trinickia caryophylli]GLU33100.1 AraC family transcriptional regulator [Trinickia caryophylli]